MAAAGSEFIRQTPRAPLRATVAITLPDGDVARGYAVDISATGIAVRMDRRLRQGDRVTIAIDISALPASAVSERLPELSGKVTWSSRDGQLEGRPMFKTGLLFASVPDSATRALRELPLRLAGGTGPLAVPAGDKVGPELAQTAAGRERLYQIALERLSHKDHAGARAAVRASLSVIPHARHMRALLCRVDAEAALADGKPDDARARIAHGQRLAPDDPIWAVLERRCAEASAPARSKRPSLIARLFGERDPA